MSPLFRHIVIGIVGLLIAGGLVALGLLGDDSDLSVLTLLAAGLVAAGVGLFLYVQGWIWGARTARQRRMGTSVAFAVGGGLMALVAGVALAGIWVLVLLFYLG
ncbi:MAG TPA: hypothetical protein VLA76_06640 [Candidatus Angelobacter sp.]|nr:hypothetical protein [Candidatus Angelobacter sp.]